MFGSCELACIYGVVTLQVSKLDLSHNGMRRIPPGSFETLHQTLNELDLGHNDLVQLSPHAFLDFHLLQLLGLSHNRLGEALRAGLTGNLFDSLQLVQLLDLSYNGITEIPAGDLTSLHHLNTLNLQGNLIRELSETSVDRTRVLAKLVLSSNRLHSVDVDVLSRLDYLEEIDLSDNPFECTCTLVPFIGWVNSTMVALQGAGGGDRTRYACDFPPFAVGQSIFAQRLRPEACHEELALRQSAGDGPAGPRGGEGGYKGATGLVIALTCGVTALVGVGLGCYFGQVGKRVKNMRYRWQIRYREVSGVETAVEPKV